MKTQLASQKLNDELLTYLFDGQSHLLTKPMETWLASSRRFATFVNTFRDKIRKKLRTMPDLQRQLDLQLELETAYLLLRERSLSVVYEPHLGQVRYPDFAVSFTTSLTFMIEVTRIRTTQKQPPASLESERLADTVCEKLGQLLPRHSNVLLIGMEGSCPTQADIQAVMLSLQQRVEKNDAPFLQQHGFRSRSDFFSQYQRLSEILVRDSNLHMHESMVTWINPQAKYPLPGKVRIVLCHSQTV